MCKQIVYSKTFSVLWSDLDPNGHLRCGRYLDYAAEMPFHFLKDNGFDFGMFAHSQIGPVIFRQGIQYLKEVGFGDKIILDIRLLGCSPDAARWAFRYRITNQDQEAVAVAEADGAFFSRVTRKTVPPPFGLNELIQRLNKEPDFRALDASSGVAMTDFVAR